MANILPARHYEESSVFLPGNILREVRRQKTYKGLQVCLRSAYSIQMVTWQNIYLRITLPIKINSGLVIIQFYTNIILTIIPYV